MREREGGGEGMAGERVCVLIEAEARLATVVIYSCK